MDIQERITHIQVSTTGSVRDALQAINRGTLGLALIIDAQTQSFSGLVTDGDIRRALLNGQDLETSISQVQRPKPVVAAAGTPPEKLAELFTEKVRIIPLLDADGRAVDLAFYERRIHLPVAAPILGDRELSYVTECVLTGWISSAGPFVSQFEEVFAKFCNVPHAISTTNGTCALHLALAALDIGPGDEVIVPSLTFIATANAVAYTGAKPVFVDVTPDTWTIDPAAIEQALTPKTRAIIPVHLYGHPADLDPIIDIANRYGLAIVEDAAEAHGARYKDTIVGGLGDVGIFSFYGNKIVTTGEGGMITTHNTDLANKLRQLRDHGMDPTTRYLHPRLGYNYRMTNLQAAIGVAQMEKIDRILDAKQKIAALYAKGLRDIPGLNLPSQASWAQSVCWLYTLTVDPHVFGKTRDELMALLNQYQVDSRPVFIPCHKQPIYDTPDNLPISDRLSATGLSLPSGLNLSDTDIKQIVEIIRSEAAIHASLV